MKRRTIVFIGSLGLGLLFFFFFIGQRGNSPKTQKEGTVSQQTQRALPTPSQASNVLVIGKGPYAPKRITLKKGVNHIETPAYTKAIVSDPQNGDVFFSGRKLESNGIRFEENKPLQVTSSKDGVTVYLYYEYKYKHSHYVRSQLGG